MPHGRLPTSPGKPDREAHTQAAPMVDVLSPRVHAARALWTSGRLDEGAKAFAEALRHEPNNVQAYIAAARSYAERFEFARMDQGLEALVRKAPEHPGVHHYVAETYGMLKLPDRAITSYERAAGLSGAGPPTWMELASLYERGHRLDEAGEMIERTVRSGFDHPLVWLVRGRIERRQKRPEQAEAIFRALIARTPSDSEWACQAWGELALMKDGQGDFVGAVEAIEQSKRSQRSREAKHWAASEKVHALMRTMVAAITRDDLRRWRDAAAGAGLTPQRVALLTGFPRSGTTLLEQLLDAHPDLVSSEERDFVGTELPRTFTAGRGNTPMLDVLNGVPVEQVALQRRRYFHFMEYLLGEPVAGRMHLDKNPAYNLTIPLMLRLFPETRLIVALRDPRDVVVSCYLRYLPLNAVSVRFLDVRRTAERYALDMAAWLKFRETWGAVVPWCEVRYEDTVADPETQARRALATLGLPWDERVLAYRQRLTQSKRVTSPSYEAVAQPIYTRAIGRWKYYASLLEPAMATLQPFVREFGYGE
jgi:tetratricopeptide (TPR) repeat protein